MKVQQISTNFKGIPISKVKINASESKYVLYELENGDEEFLKKLYKKTNLKTLMPNLRDEEGYETWDWVLKNAINSFGTKNSKTLLETCNNKPCGIMNYKDIDDKYYLKFITTFPIQQNKRLPFAGQVLINELFRRFIDTKNNIIELTALRYSPFSPISKYMQLGFKMYGGTGFSEVMKINRENVEKTLFAQKTLFAAEKLKNQKSVNLEYML